jgi:hypothetical protein
MYRLDSATFIDAASPQLYEDNQFNIKLNT